MSTFYYFKKEINILIGNICIIQYTNLLRVKNKCYDRSIVQTLGSGEDSDLSTVETDVNKRTIKKNRQEELNSKVKKLYYGLQTFVLISIIYLPSQSSKTEQILNTTQ